LILIRPRNTAVKSHLLLAHLLFATGLFSDAVLPPTEEEGGTQEGSK